MTDIPARVDHARHMQIERDAAEAVRPGHIPTQLRAMADNYIGNDLSREQTDLLRAAANQIDKLSAALHGVYIPDNRRSSDEVYSLMKTEENRPAWDKRK